MTNNDGRMPEPGGVGVAVSDTAMDALSRALDSSKQNDNDLLRISRSDNRLELTLGAQEAGDDILEWEEKQVLAVSPEARELLDGFVLDAETTEQGMALVLRETPGRF